MEHGKVDELCPIRSINIVVEEILMCSTWLIDTDRGGVITVWFIDDEYRVDDIVVVAK